MRYWPISTYEKYINLKVVELNYLTFAIMIINLIKSQWSSLEFLVTINVQVEFLVIINL